MVCHPHETERFARTERKAAKASGRQTIKPNRSPRPSKALHGRIPGGRAMQSETRIGDRKITQDKCKAGGSNTLVSSTFVWTISRQITERDSSQFVGKMEKKKTRGSRGSGGHQEGWPGPDLVPEPC
ncbi:hypothetical protein V8C44DRAFT_168940 [Trichoderma aethiopicum]